MSTLEEKICKVLIAKGKWTIARCQLCRRINPVKCKVAVEQNQQKKGGGKND
jgi:hypothetical protein